MILQNSDCIILPFTIFHFYVAADDIILKLVSIYCTTTVNNTIVHTSHMSST